MSRIVIEKKIYLEPNLLDEGIAEHIYDRICHEMLNKCDQECGYILKVYENVQILENSISSVGSGAFFHVRFSVKALKPEVGQEHEGQVCMVFQGGIFVEVAGKMKVLIPAEKMKNYKYNKALTVFKHDKKTISEGDTVKLAIEMIKYEKQNFNCIGKLI